MILLNGNLILKLLIFIVINLPVKTHKKLLYEIGYHFLIII